MKGIIMSKHKASKTPVLPAHIVANALVPLVTEVYEEKVRPKIVEWLAERQYKKLVKDVENFNKKVALKSH